jgi:biopolymer transport protein ExbB
MFDFLAKGGILMIPIFLCSVLALAIFVERLIRFSRIKSRGGGLAREAAALIEQGGTERAHELLVKSDSPIGRVLVAAMDVKNRDRETLEAVIAHATADEVRNMSAYIQTLATIGNIAPLLGLLGTVFGMIKAFMVIEQMGGKVNSAVLAGGIWEAMLTTAAGLTVALPTMVAHSYLLSRVDRHEARLQEGAVTFLAALSHGQKPEA